MFTADVTVNSAELSSVRQTRLPGNPQLPFCQGQHRSKQEAHALRSVWRRVVFSVSLHESNSFCLCSQQVYYHL